MKVTKIEVTDAGALEKLVVAHLDSIEPGLVLVDSRLMLGHATIDLVAQDAAGSLVLVALGFRAEENMLLRVVDAYSWCLEYPEAVQRHYPSLMVSEDRPPRVVFVMSRVPESFQRKIKQLSFPSVDAVEFHHLDVDGTATVFFDAIARIRRGVPTMTMAHAEMAPPDITIRTLPVAPAPAPAPVPVRVAIEPVRTAPTPVRLAAEISAVLASNGNTPRVIDAVAPVATLPVAPLRTQTAAAAVATEEVMAPAIAGGSDGTAAAPIEAEVETASAAELAPEPASVAVAVAEPPAEPEAAVDSEAAKATKIAKELGIELPKEGALTRQWIDFLNSMAAK